MRLFFHYCSYGFSNSYVLSNDNCSGSPAIVIDPGCMDKQFLEYIETSEYDLKAVLITHDHLGHIHGLRTLRRIYNAEIFAFNRVVLDIGTTQIKDEDKIVIGPFTVEVISIPGHSADSVVYRIGNFLFTGDVLTAGLVGSTSSGYGASTQVNKLRSRLLSLPGDYLVFPGHGPPSTLEAERRFNIGISQYAKTYNRKPGLKINL